MTKRQLIDEILAMNGSADPSFLAGFEHTDLSEYLLHLQTARTPKLCGDARRYEKYFENCPVVAAAPVALEAPHAAEQASVDKRGTRRPPAVTSMPWRHADDDAQADDACEAMEIAALAEVDEAAAADSAGAQSWLF